VAISIEARREAVEQYGIWKGLGRNYELIYVIGDERDVIGKRAAFGTFDVYLYPVTATREKVRHMFVGMLERANRLRAHPEFYNTATNNCTSNLVSHVNQVTPGRIPSGVRVLLPGYADEVGRELGLVPRDVSLERLRLEYRINDRARRHRDDPEFSRLIRAAPNVPGPDG
jgi:hypothetical protein